MKYSNHKRLKYTVSFICCLLVLSYGTSIYAQGQVQVGGSNTGTTVQVPGNTTGGTLQNPLQVNSIGDAVNKGVEIFSYIAILVAVIMIIYVGLKFIMAQGKPDKLKEAGKWLGAIVIGVVIILGARLMISIIINTLEATKVVSPTVIQSARSVVNGTPQQ